MAEGKKNTNLAEVAGLVSKAWLSADNASISASTAAKALETLRTQVVSGTFDLSGGIDCDMDTFYVFTEGIIATIREAEKEANRARELLGKVKKSGALPENPSE